MAKNLKILLVDKNDKVVGRGEKLAVHKASNLHRAFSVFVFDKNKRLLLQKRVATKYHSMGLWSNACCSHPISEKDIKTQAEKQLQKEMGFSIPLQEKFILPYKAKVKAQNRYLTENEIDHCLVGFYNGTIKPNPKETDGYQWLAMKEIKKQIKQNPSQFTYWFRKIIKNKDLCQKLLEIKNK